MSYPIPTHPVCMYDGVSDWVDIIDGLQSLDLGFCAARLFLLISSTFL
jgi:hypothetical protein